MEKKSLRILGPQIWNSLPNEYKTTNLDQFKYLMSQWRGTKYIEFIFFYDSQFLLAVKAIFHTDLKYSSLVVVADASPAVEWSAI